MQSRNRGPNSAQLWGLDDVTALRPRTKPPSRPSLPRQAPDTVSAEPPVHAPGGELVLLLTVEDAGKALGISRSTMYELIGAGDLEVVHIRRSVRVPIDALHDFVRRLRAGRVNSATSLAES